MSGALRIALGLVAVLCAEAIAHGGGFPPPPPPPMPVPPRPITPPGGVPPGLRKPKDPDPPPPPLTPPERNPGPVTPPDKQPPVPLTPPDRRRHETPDGEAPTIPPVEDHRGNRPVTRRPSQDGDSWRTWWEYNREYLLGLRRAMRDAVTLTGDASARELDPLGERRGEVREALRELAENRLVDRMLRASALLALGRVGTEEDHILFLRVLGTRGEMDAVHEAAALGLGLLPPFETPDARENVREQLDYFLNEPGALPARARAFALVTMGLRGRDDPVLALSLAAPCASRGVVRDGHEAAALLFACGLTRNEALLPELMNGALEREAAGHKLDDVGRSHAALALGLTRSAKTALSLARLLDARSSGVQTRRGAALALGRLLREAELDPEAGLAAERALRSALEKGRDSVLRSYAAISLACARRPLALDALREAIDKAGDPVLKPYAALGLGLAARDMTGAEADSIRAFLLEEWEKAREIELSSALCVAVGLAGARDATPGLLERVARRSLPAPVRGAAAQGLGLLGNASDEIADALFEALRSPAPELAEDAALALGLLGRRGTAATLAEMLPSLPGLRLQGRLTIALGMLGQDTAVEPLLAILRDATAKIPVRESAAVALGLLGQRAASDPLFDLDAFFNTYATTLATHELLQIY
ncbi:MAG: hypothetical protein ACT4PV_10240 [Planctomycetaceae bacterium]